ncbi:MAG: methyl-accepting chemotaxis protein [Desulfuromonas sp.]|nr:MAG: methyl-accepting chemotaxis protein [Desulfuromonas sp.]
MFIKRYLQTLKTTRVFMIGFGLAMGIVFPFYSAVFFGSEAFNPLYAVGCVIAGLLVGLFSYWCIRQVLSNNLEAQCNELTSLVGMDTREMLAGEGDHLSAQSQLQSELNGRIFRLIEAVQVIADEFVPIHRILDEGAIQLADGNRAQTDKFVETSIAAENMARAFGEIIREVEALAERASDRTALSTEMSATTDEISERAEQFHASILETSASIEEMAASIRETAENIDYLAESTEQTSGSIIQISATTGQMRDNAQRTSEASKKVREQAQEGISAMRSMLKAVEQIEGNSQQSLHAIKRLSEQTTEIGSFLSIITEIVEQTNLLSLNASIIAAQAGDKGRAFAVVAEEVRSLAQRTAASTQEIEGLVEGIQRETDAVEKTINAGAKSVSDGVETSRAADDALHRIQQSADEASEMVQKIASGAIEQASGSNLIAQEAEKNLDRVRHSRKAIQEQEGRILHIVHALEQMKILAQQINTATSEQSKGNRKYLESVVNDNEKAQVLKETALQQMIYGDQVKTFISETSEVLQQNSKTADQLIARISEALSLTDKLKDEVDSFRQGGRGKGPSDEDDGMEVSNEMDVENLDAQLDAFFAEPSK